MMPMANVMISIVKELKESGEFEKRFGDLPTSETTRTAGPARLSRRPAGAAG
jgi:hypothetical protein